MVAKNCLKTSVVPNISRVSKLWIFVFGWTVPLMCLLQFCFTRFILGLCKNVNLTMWNIFSFFRKQMLKKRIRNKKSPKSRRQRKSRNETSRWTQRRCSQTMARFVLSERCFWSHNQFKILFNVTVSSVCRRCNSGLLYREPWSRKERRRRIRRRPVSTWRRPKNGSARKTRSLTRESTGVKSKRNIGWVRSC